MKQEEEQVNEKQKPPFVSPQIVVNYSVTAPILHPNKLAQDSGVTEGVVGGWIDNGYIPTVKVGRYQMINMVLLVENLKRGVVL